MVNKSDNSASSPDLSAFGLSKAEETVYIELLRHGVSTPVDISRKTGINRTTAYRILDSLSEKGFVNETLAYKSRRFSPTGPKDLQLLVSQKQAELDSVKKHLPVLEKQLQDLASASDPATRIYYFKGQSGLRQLLFNTLSATTDVIGLGYGNWNDGIGKRYAEKLRAEYVARPVYTRELLNRPDKAGYYTDIPGYFGHVYRHRAISEKILPITHDTYIYNDVFAFYHTVNGEQFGIEIHNAAIASTERAMFEILWKLAKPVPYEQSSAGNHRRTSG